MNRKQFIESLGATCKNWNWSWSFINEKEKQIFFGAWDVYDDGNMSLILSERWEKNGRGRKSNGYPQSREHIRLIEEEGYSLLIFPMIYSDENLDPDGTGPAKIGDFIKEVTPKSLIRVGGDWFASDSRDQNRIIEEIPESNNYIEGASKRVTVNAYERNREARAKCLAHFGYTCLVCGFNFEKVYGEIGKDFVHVHHKIPLGEIKSEYVLNPITDLVPVCPNCHAMIHRTQPALSIESLKKHLSKEIT
jgi:5-methylcytosine-specific restriction enzyme A